MVKQNVTRSAHYFSLLNAGQLAENSKVDVHKEQKDAYVYVQKRKINNFIAENSKVDVHKEQKDAYVYVQKRKINNFILYINEKANPQDWLLSLTSRTLRLMLR